MSDHWPETRDELIARFCEPDHNGRIWIEDREQFEKFVDLALSRPDPSYSYAFKDDPEKQPKMTADTLCHRIHDCGFFLDSYTGWIDPEGFFWRCNFASHERLLELMGMNSIEVELEGWVKLSRYHAHARYLPNEVQCARILALSEECEKENAFRVNLQHLAELKPLRKRKKA